MSKQNNTQKILRPRDLFTETGLSRTTIWRISNDPTNGFPKKIQLSAGAVGYFREEIESWLKNRPTVLLATVEQASHSAVPTPGKRRGRKAKNVGVTNEK